MRRRPLPLVLAGAVAAGTAAAAVAAAVAPSGGPLAPAAAAAATWRLEQPAPPAGSPYKVPLGRPGDLSCWSATRCLLAVEGNAIVARGLYAYDGVEWRQLSTVCGGVADTTRIAWAGPTEFWTITEPSPPRIGGGLGLCRFRDGQVVASYSTPPESAEPFRVMTAAACNGPADCWFGGVGAQDPTGQRIGAYHLHWDGQTLTSSYAPQGRGVSDLVAAGDRYYETTYVGAQREDRETPVTLARSEDGGPETIHTIVNGSFANALFLALPRRGVPPAGTELLAADVAAWTVPWFVGGGAASGPDAPADASVARPPIAVRDAGGFYREVPLDETPFGEHDRFTDVAAVPGGTDAWATLQSYQERGSATARGRVARIGPDGTIAVQRLPAAGAGRGAAARIEFTGSDEGWMVTNAGWLFHFTDGAQRGRDADPAFARLITYRPNEALAQAIPDTPPVDDSQLFAPPPVEAPRTAEDPVPTTRRVKALMARLSKPKVDRRLRLRLSFTLRRPARVQLQAKRKGKVVARTPLRALKPGRHTLTLQLDRRRWPDALRFRTFETRAR
ncbi:hypothetical protein [Conexibacter woesei]|uniref:Uncharacterized protein n=1 Tax=Conexibacter woesei (strain DSM 14684 / CCUG 47730 / CIP 108061 / JCM 11494 / NBRC 100937 / ID131577) TaxID=469383 RepID=D3FA79_CONWI|nr:hypothetical protein [Conexibacter woesei]ADB53174.1 hypothetical protein Cwoe_4761 [Conexibacter woesei DSM 14684]